MTDEPYRLGGADATSGYRVDHCKFGELEPGDATITDPVFGLVYVVGVQPINSPDYPMVKLHVEGRSLAFSRRESPHSNIRYIEWTDVRYADGPCIRLRP